MSNTLFVFNPDHELALASFEKNFQPKKNIQKIVEDLSTLPLWIKSNCYVLNSGINSEWKVIAERLNLQYCALDKIPYVQINDCEIWGWNPSIRRQLLMAGLSEKILPDDCQLQKIKVLTHRKTSIEAMKYLHKQLKIYKLPTIPTMVDKVNKALEYAEQDTCKIFKSPFSSSGRGIFTNKYVDNSFITWIKTTIKEQKNVIIEDFYDVIQNFAMEFIITQNEQKSVSFTGYSLFENNGVKYKHNILTTDKQIENHLSKYVDLSILNRVKEIIIDFIGMKIKDFYVGHIGVDMFIYRENSQFLLHPCVEINLRPTMGAVAHDFYKNFVNQNSNGIFAVDFFDSPEKLRLDHTQRLASTPPEIHNGRLIEGYLWLCPILENTKYRVRVEVNSEQ
jgi:hypothetical protein